MSVFDTFSKRRNKTVYYYRFEHEGKTYRSKAIFRKQSDAITAEVGHRTRLNYKPYATLSQEKPKSTTIADLINELMDRRAAKTTSTDHRNVWVLKTERNILGRFAALVGDDLKINQVAESHILRFYKSECERGIAHDTAAQYADRIISLMRFATRTHREEMRDWVEP